MLQIERFQAIEHILEEKNSITIPELVSILDTSKATVYRDIKTLQEQGKLLFVHGGISKAPTERRIELPYHVKRSSFTEEKRRIAGAASKLIEPNTTIWLDSSTCVFEILPYLDPQLNISVVTNDLMIAAELSAIPDIPTHVIGGTVRKGYYTLVGLFAQNNLVNLQIDIAFFGADAVNSKGCMLLNTDEVAIKKQVLSCSGTNVLLADHGKFNANAFVSFCSAGKMDYILTGRELSDEIFEGLRNQDIRVTRV